MARLRYRYWTDYGCLGTAYGIGIGTSKDVSRGGVQAGVVATVTESGRKTRRGSHDGGDVMDEVTDKDKFLAEYRTLCTKYGIVVTSCGCCPNYLDDTLDKHQAEDYFKGLG